MIDIFKDILYYTRRLESESDPIVKWRMEKQLELLEDKLLERRLDKENDVNRTI
jgi:hypothetical protein